MMLTVRWVSAPVACPTRLELLLGELLDLGQVVVAVAHALAQFGVRAPGLLGGGDRLARPPRAARGAGRRAPRASSSDMRCVTGGSPAARGPRRAALRCIRSSSISSAARGLGGSRVQQVAPPARRAPSRSLQQRQLRFALAVLDQRQLAAGDPGGCAELVESESALGAEVADALSQRGEIGVDCIP